MKEGSNWPSPQEELPSKSSALLGLNSKNVKVVPLKDKKGIAITNSFQKFLDKSNRKPKEI